jgi:beta-phosphoglucomutase
MPYHVKAWQTVFGEMDIEVNPEEVLLEEGTTAHELSAKILADNHKSISEKQHQRLVDKKQSLYREILDAGVHPDLKDLLMQLKHYKLKTGLVTGSSTDNIYKAFDSQLLGLFDTIITGDDVENGKPSPEGYLCAAASLDLSSDDCLVVENAPLGIEAAKRAGMKVMALTTTLSRDQLAGADYYREDLSKKIVEQLIEIVTG